MRGRVLWYSRDKGYGFIEADEKADPTEPDVFVHIKDLQVCGIWGLNPNDVVEFELGQGRQGKTCAKAIKFVRSGQPQHVARA